MKCIDCKNFSLRANPQMARLGFGSCVVFSNSYTSLSPVSVRECSMFIPAPADVVEQRREWLEPSRRSKK